MFIVVYCTNFEDSQAERPQDLLRHFLSIGILSDVILFYVFQALQVLPRVYLVACGRYALAAVSVELQWSSRRRISTSRRRSYTWST